VSFRKLLSVSVLAAALGTVKREEIGDNRDAAEDTAPGVKPARIDENILTEDPRRQAENQRCVGYVSHALGSGVKSMKWNTHFLHFSFQGLRIGSVVEPVPEKHRHLDDHKDQRNGEQIPAPDVVEEDAVLEDADGNQSGYDSGDAAGAAAMLQEALINKCAKNRNSAENRVCHCLFSN
jgi:hypothetical protein